MLRISLRQKDIVSGLIAVTLVAAAVTVGVKFSFGAFDSGYELTASFEAAGQGLSPESDVKIRGVNVGEVTGVELVDGRAFVTMRIAAGEDVPVSAVATVRAKTLFGEKYVDIIPGAGETDGPFLADGGRIEQTSGGFELERVLSDAYPVFKAINPEELMTVLSGFAEAGAGLGEVISRQIVNTEKVLAVQTAHDADLRRFLADLAALSGELAGRSDDVVSAAEDLNVALPTLSANADDLNTLLVQTGRLATDLADVIDGNRAFIDANFDEGQDTLDLLYDHRGQVIPLVVGLRQYIQTLAEVGRIPGSDGTMLAAVKNFVAADVCEQVPAACDILANLAGNLPLDPVPSGLGLNTAGTATGSPPTSVTTDLLGGITQTAGTTINGVVELLLGVLR
ncbi:MAG: MlaD family protein [Acidimicrobiales bacterium]